MKKVVTATALATIVMTPLVMLAAPSPAQAKGCIKGALVGGVAGHYAGHHGVLGAAAGCIIGRHQAKRQQQANPSAAR
jgi:outer membrane lipoprotein SlyB